MAATVVNGLVAPGFERVAEAFEQNFSERGELGGAFAAYTEEGEPVVDLWGGVASRETGQPWQVDTTQVIFSGTKGLVAICLLVLLERGAIELTQPVSRYWPEFGKPHIRVRDVVSHAARLPGIDVPVSIEQFLDYRYMATLLANQESSDDPRATLCYHPMTYGWLCGELVRRVDGRSIGSFFANEIATPLGLEIWVGLPEPEERRVATLELDDNWAIPFLDPAVHAHDRFLWSVWGNPPVMSRATFPWNEREFHAAEIPGAGAIGTARSIAKLYANLDKLLTADTLALGRTTLSEGWDEPRSVDVRFGVGFELSNHLQSLGPVGDAFGHQGAGGSVHGCWPQQRLGFSYVMNLLRADEGTDGRGATLLKALFEAAR